MAIRNGKLLISFNEEVMILLLNDMVTITWNNSTKNKYIKAGYNYTRNGDEFDVPVHMVSKCCSAKVQVQCDYCGIVYETTVELWNRGHKTIEKDSCASCSGRKLQEVLRFQNAPNIFEKLINICEQNNYTLLTEQSSYSGEKMLVDFICPKHGAQSMSIDNLLHGHKCIQCSYDQRGENKKITREELIKSIERLNHNKILNPEEYINSTVYNLKILCGSCRKNTFMTSLGAYKIDHCQCRQCSQRESSGEKIIREFLEKHNISFIQEYYTTDCCDKRLLPFDFYLPDYNLIIEFDGRQHFEPIYGEQCLINTQRHDKIKNQYCLEHNIELIRIPYWEGQEIEKIIVNKLDEISKRYGLNLCESISKDNNLEAA